MNPEAVQFLGNAQLISDLEIDSFTLATVAQGGIVKFHFGFHGKSRLSAGAKKLLEGKVAEKC